MLPEVYIFIYKYKLHIYIMCCSGKAKQPRFQDDVTFLHVCFFTCMFPLLSSFFLFSLSAMVDG